MKHELMEVDEQILDEEGTSDESSGGGWRNLYLILDTGAIAPGAFLWETKQDAEEAATSRGFPEANEYLGAFKEDGQ